MNNSVCLKCVLFLLLALAALDASANKRGVRVDNSSDWTLGSIGDDIACPGTSAGYITIQSMGLEFLGKASTDSEDYTLNDYCEVALPGTLNETEYFHGDENGLRALFRDGTGITGIRYSFLDNADPSLASGFQWGFYTFPSGATLVALYGLDGSTGIVPDATSYITDIWSGANGYDGQYFCFDSSGTFVEAWYGNVSEANSACLQAVGVIFINDFE